MSANFRFSARHFRKRNFCSEYIFYFEVGEGGGGGGNCPHFPSASYGLVYTCHWQSKFLTYIIRHTRPIYHRQSTDTPPTINGRRIGRVSAAIYRPTIGRYLGRYVDHHSAYIHRSICRPTHLGRHIDRLSTDISVDISTDTRPICRPIHWSRVGRYVDRYIGRGCTKYTWSKQGVYRGYVLLHFPCGTI